ncbi:UNVERIFIED_CONTAM: Long chain base biosynthesis protein 1 [Sesamum latifolium]|uniref:Long chain base biosynthesis protein 1 n=1 Tax=Sesamum latifolium TaxID=2727402 RepID=A0AAW2TD45_9LAMI
METVREKSRFAPWVLRNKIHWLLNSLHSLVAHHMPEILFCFSNANALLLWQRLSSSGYVFSVSLPPYLASAAITTIDALEGNPVLITKLKESIVTLHKDSGRIIKESYSPLIGRAVNLVCGLRFHKCEGFLSWTALFWKPQHKTMKNFRTFSSVPTSES